MVAFPETLRKVVSQIFRDTDTPRSLALDILLRNGEYGQLTEMVTDPENYTSPHQYFLDTVATDLLRKFRGFDVPGLDLERDALATFESCESQCKRTNDRLDRFINHGPFEGSDLYVQDFVADVKKVIREILGPLPATLNPWQKFGKGSTLDDRGRLTTIPDKMTSRPTVTYGARCLLPFWEETAWCRALVSDAPRRSDPKTVRGNRFTTVPKDSRKVRGICVEPSINLFQQLAVGQILKARLRTVGLDLREAQTQHRLIAQASSVNGEFATIDLSNASDTVAFKLIKLLLPESWFGLLNSLRSPVTHIGGRNVVLEKFSSMGNGFTFELETLVFLAISVAVAQRHGYAVPLGTSVRVYGDDIIVPTTIATDVLSALRFFGFTPNRKKTFLQGHFRESCGGDFFDGWAVRPFQLEEEPTHPAAWIAFANGLRRTLLAHHRSYLHRYRKSRFKILDELPTNVRRLRGPNSLGDLVVNDDEGWQYGETADWQGFVLAWLPIPERISLDHWKPSIQLASALYGIPSSGVTSRDAVSGYRVGWVSIVERAVKPGTFTPVKLQLRRGLVRVSRVRKD